MGRPDFFAASSEKAVSRVPRRGSLLFRETEAPMEIRERMSRVPRWSRGNLDRISR